MKTLLLVLAFIGLIVLACRAGESKDYTGKVLRVIDGDTFEAFVGLGLDVYKKETVRIWGIDAPEMNTAKGVFAKKRLEDLIGTAEVDLIMLGREKYGRLLCKVLVEGRDVGDQMVREGYAEKYFGGKRTKQEDVK